MLYEANSSTEMKLALKARTLYISGLAMKTTFAFHLFPTETERLSCKEELKGDIESFRD